MAKHRIGAATRARHTWRCNCENTACAHVPGGHTGMCKNEPSGARVMMLGPVCDKCARHYDTEYLYPPHGTYQGD